MQITFFSFVMSLLGSSTLTILIYFFRRKSYAVRLFGIRTVCILYLFCLIRMLFPFEFSAAKIVDIPFLYNGIYGLLCLNNLQIGRVCTKPVKVLAAVWGITAVFLALKFAFSYFRGRERLLSSCVPADERFRPYVNRIEAEYARPFPVSIMISQQVSGPMGMGLFQKYILMPDIEYTDHEAYYILLHEYTHFYNKDIALKLLTHLYCCIFWWNPLTYLLEKDLAQLLEIKCDLTITERLGKTEVADYLSAIVAVLRREQERGIDVQAFDLGAISLMGSSSALLTERFNVIASNKSSFYGRNYSRLLWAAAFILVFLFSYQFIFQASYEPEVIEIAADEATYEITFDEYYIRKNGDGTYTLNSIEGDDVYTIDESSMNMMKASGFYVKEE